MENQKIPLVDLKANYNSIKEEMDKGIMETIETCYFVNGPEVKTFEKKFAEFTETKHCVTCNSGTDALILALKSLKIGKGDEVITQANTFIATTLAISSVGATPVLVDVDDHYMIDCEKIESVITEKTKAIIVVHLYGCCPNMDKILEIKEKHNLFLVEDSAQAAGTRYNGKHVGGFGDLGCFSFYPGKNLGAFGDGGAVITNNDVYANYMYGWRNWGCGKKKYYHETKGGNSRLDSVQAKVLTIKLKYLNIWNESRRQNAKLYEILLKNVGDIITPSYYDFCTPTWHLYVIRTKYRDELLEYLKKNNIFAGIHYPIPIHKLGAYKDEMDYEGKLVNCEKYANEIISFPMYPELTEEKIIYICNHIKTFYKDI
jgi:dTDP-4-amino-4,6-dideoxygalactose transaminase